MARQNGIMLKSGQGLTPRGHTLSSNGRDSTSTNGLCDKWPEDDPASGVVSSRDRQANIELTGSLSDKPVELRAKVLRVSSFVIDDGILMTHDSE